MSRRNVLKTLIILVLSLFVILPTMEQFALSAESAVGGMTLLLKSQSKGDDDNDGDPSNVADESVETKVDTSSRCGPEAILPVEVCEIAQGPLCLNTPPFSVSDNYVVVKGSVDRRTSVFSHIQAYAQQEYTKSFDQVVIERWASSDCWEDEWIGTSDACLDQKGLFAIRVPLAEMGPYTIMIDAVSLDGEATSKTVRTSRVEAPKMNRDDITLDPDPATTGGVIEARKVIVKVDLLHGCKFCDFIGTSTGGVMITIENMIESSAGGTKTIVRQGNIAAGGVFDICVPVLDGKNDLTVTACSAATESSTCPEVGGVSFDVISNDAAIDVMLPDRSLYASRDYPTIPLKFSVANLDGKTNECKEGDVVVHWNRLDPVSLCPESDGYYYAQLTPTTGINAGTIDVSAGMETISQSFVFGWGKLVNPYIDPSSGWVQNGVGLQLGSEYINEMLRPLINSFLNSDGLTTMVADLMSTIPTMPKEEKEAPKKSEPDPLASILEELPYCDAGGGLEGTVVELVGDIGLDRVEIERLDFKKQSIGFKLNLEGVEIHLKTFGDDNKDGRPDGFVLPILVAMRAAQLDGKIEIMPDGKPLVLLTSDNDDCDYKVGAYCTDRPAILLPKNLVGGATKGGALARCDDKTQQLSEKDRQICIDINLGNAESAELNQTVLDLVNTILYCKGSAMLTHMLREELKDQAFELPLLDHPFWLGGGVAPFEGWFSVDEKGIDLSMPTRVGGASVAKKLDNNVFRDDVGIFLDDISSSVVKGGVKKDRLKLALSTSTINELLFQLVFQKEGSGLLDWELDNTFFKRRDFDYVQECDAFEPTTEIQTPPALCQLRPRVMEMLGSALPTNGYLSNKHPLQLKLKGSRNLAPHVKIYQTDVPYELPPVPGEDEIQIEYRPADVLEIQIPDLEVSFYALEIDESKGLDEFGNPSVLLNEDEIPVVRSMIPGSPEPAPIIKVRATLLIALEVGQIYTPEDDASKLAFSIRPISEYSRIIFKKIPGGNATTVPDNSILSSFREKLRYGIEIYGDPDEPLEIKIPKSVSLEMLNDFLGSFNLLDLNEVFFGKDGFSLKLNHASDRIEIEIKPEFK